MSYGNLDDRERPTIEGKARKGKGPMDAGEFESLIKGVITESKQWTDNELSVQRALATDYYLGMPFGNEEEGRSQVVLTEVRDAVLGVLPSLIRVLLGADYPVEFVPRRANAVEQAAQATDYVRYVFLEDNPGFLNTISVLKDGLVRKIGIFKWGWDESISTKAYRMEGVTGDELRALAADDSIKFTSITPCKPYAEDEPIGADSGEYPVQTLPQPEAPAAAAPGVQPPPAPAPSPAPQPGAPPVAPPAPEPLYDVELTKTDDEGRARIWTLPPEEFIWNREARGLETTLFVGHRTQKTRGELIAMGVSEKDLDAHAAASEGSSDIALNANPEQIARMNASGVTNTLGSGTSTDPEMGEANDKILYVEGYFEIDFDGDGIPELRKVCTIGQTFYPVYNKPCSERPFSIFVADPEPHTLLGQSWADRLMDIQKISSSLLRSSLDSLAASIYPRMTYEEGYASVSDMMNTAIGAPIRIRKPGAVQSFAHPYVGDKAMPLLDAMKDIIERRTGRNKGVAGLDASALQSTDKEGVQAAISGSQEQAEMLARLFAEGAMKPMFKGLLRLLIENQPKARVVRLRGKWVDVDPRSWDADMDVQVNVALGAGFTEKKIATLISIYGEQKEILQTYGPTNPICTVAMARNTLAKISELQGIRDVDSYFLPVAPNWQPPPPQAPPPSPEQIMAETNLKIETMKAERSLTEKKDELGLKEKQIDNEFQFKIRELATNAELKKYAIDAQFHSTMTQSQMDDNINREVAEAELTIKGHDQLHDQAVERATAAHGMAMNERAADTADAAQQASAAAPTDSEGGE